MNWNELLSLAICILRTLMINLLNSFLGISIVADAPQCRNVNLNIKQPGVLRQYYGSDIEKLIRILLEEFLIVAKHLFNVKVEILIN